jgi:hypothetical protein
MMGGMNRYKSSMKALRKQRIYPGYYDNLHQYSKNKIHCSCFLCSAKSNKYRGRGISINYKISDLRKIDRLNYSG